MWRSMVARETSSRGWRSNFIGRGLAQLVARAAGGGEVVGSNPATPTNKITTLMWSQVSLRSSGSLRNYEPACISLRSPPPNLVIPTNIKYTLPGVYFYMRLAKNTEISIKVLTFLTISDIYISDYCVIKT